MFNTTGKHTTVRGRCCYIKQFKNGDRDDDRDECFAVFREEFKRMTRLHEMAEEEYDRHFARYLDCGFDAFGCPYLLMEDLGPRTLAEHLNSQSAFRGLLPGSELTKQLFQFLLECAELLKRVDMVQLDISPGNIIMVRPDNMHPWEFRMVDLTSCYDLRAPNAEVPDSKRGIGGGEVKQVNARVPLDRSVEIRLRNCCAALFGLLFFKEGQRFNFESIPVHYQQYAAIPSVIPNYADMPGDPLDAMSAWVDWLVNGLG